MPSLRAIVFDFDGLILETEEAVFRSWSEIYAEHGQEVSLDFWRTTIGTSIDAWDPHLDLERRVGRDLDRESLRARRRRRQMEMLAQQPLLPGVLALRAEAAAAGVRVGIASNSGGEWVRGHLRERGLAAAFDCIRTREDVVRPKPAPDVYLAAVACLGVEPREAVALEDSPHGVAAALAAGLRCVAVPGPLTVGLDFRAAHQRAGSIADLTLPGLAALVAG